MKHRYNLYEGKLIRQNEVFKDGRKDCNGNVECWNTRAVNRVLLGIKYGYFSLSSDLLQSPTPKQTPWSKCSLIYLFERIELKQRTNPFSRPGRRWSGAMKFMLSPSYDICIIGISRHESGAWLWQSGSDQAIFSKVAVTGSKYPLSSHL